MIKAKGRGFPRHLPEYHHFEHFMKKSEIWNKKALEVIESFKKEANDVNIKDLME